MFIKKKVLVLGDSHCGVFRKVRYRRFPYRFDFNVTDVPGATASGLENPNTQTNAYRIFKQALHSQPHSQVIVMLGEVDTGFVIWYRCAKRQIDIESSLNKTVATYCSFLSEIDAPCVVISAPLPTIQDKQDWGTVANLRKEVTASLKERTELTLQFNARIEAFCRANGIRHLNLDSRVTGADGLLRTEFYSRDPHDHHYDGEVFAQLLSRSLHEVL